MFNKVLTQDLPEPDDLKTIPHPRIGVIAGFNNVGYDYDLLAAVADQHPEWSLVLVGLVRDSAREVIAALTTRPNVFVLGYKPQPELSPYLKGFDVGLMPYRIAYSIIEGYPLKMHEYLAAGLPVVSTPQPAVLAFSDVVSIAEHADQFVALIEAALATNSPEKVTARVAVARKNSWERRVAEMEALIDPFLYGNSLPARRGHLTRWRERARSYVCPLCKSNVTRSAEIFVCGRCQMVFPITCSIPDFRVFGPRPDSDPYSYDDEFPSLRCKGCVGIALG